MSHAIKLIVDGYVRLNDQQALRDVLGHRQRIGKQLRETPRSWVDLSASIEQIDEEIAVIEAGLETLKHSAPH
ncbi:MAG: hypothetical protein JO141_27210 [Bradyrhizobium sp.]|nr:hypothetical protein [Bradyrhizobium sp.]